MEETILPKIIDLLQRTGGMTTLSADEDFYDAGITSLMTLPLMMDIEDLFSVVVPDQEFIQVRTASGLCTLVHQLKQGAA